MTNPSHTPTPAPGTCPANTPWCNRHDHDLGHCNHDVDVTGMRYITLSNGTLSGELKVFGLHDAPEALTLGALDELVDTLTSLQSMARTGAAAAPAPDVEHQAWCVEHDTAGNFCWSRTIEVAGLQLQLANSDGTPMVVGLDDAAMPDALTLDGARLLSRALAQLEDMATGQLACSRGTSWCTAEDTDEHATECMSAEVLVRPGAGSEFCLYLVAKASDTSTVWVAVDGRHQGRLLSGVVPVQDALMVTSRRLGASDAIQGLLAAVAFPQGRALVLELLAAAGAAS